MLLYCNLMHDLCFLEFAVSLIYQLHLQVACLLYFIILCAGKISSKFLDNTFEADISELMY